MKLTDVPKAMHILNMGRQHDILKYVGEFREQEAPIVVSVPTYVLPDDQFFVLDGNHRLSALAMYPVDFVVTLCNIRGPLEPDCLLDLIHWSGRANRPAVSDIKTLGQINAKPNG